MIDLQTLVQEATELEPMPASATRLASLLAEEDWRLSDIVEVVELDQALTGRLLSIANSVAGGSSHPIATVSEAVMRNGPGVVLSVSMAPVVRRQLDRPLSSYGMGEGEMWRHSIAAALSVRLSTAHCRSKAQPQSFAAALLHDVGKLILDRGLRSANPPEDGAQVRVTAADETEALGIDHSELGGIISNHWGLPVGIARGIRFHHHPEGAPDEDSRMVASFVALANMVAYGIGAGGGQDRPTLSPESIRRIGIDRGGFVKLCEATKVQLEETLAVYS